MSAAKPLLRPQHEQGVDRRLKTSQDGNRTQQKRSTTIPHGTTATSTPATSANGSTTPWTSARVEQLKTCIEAGLTCSQIAAEIGVTRNAVIGKMNRLGLSRPRLVVAREPERKRDVWRPRALTQHQILMRLPAEPPSQEEAISLHIGPGCSLLELSPGKCRWPLSRPGTDVFCFCGNSQVEGLPYCVGHARIAYKSAARPRGIVRP
jgi:GcrA cell cycle regulator